MLHALAASAVLLTAALRPGAPLQGVAAFADTVPVAAAPASGAGTRRAAAGTAVDGGWPVAQTGAARGGPNAEAPTEPAPAPFAPAAPLVTETALPNPFAPWRAPAVSAVAPVAIPIADSIVVRKRAHQLVLYERGVPLRRYAVALGEPDGDKQYLGDNRTPEGLFHIVDRNPYSRYHLALRISYPDSAHRARAAALGRSPGGDIMIHGLPRAFADVGAAHREEDWTEGCIAVTNEEIEEIWRIVPVGIPIEIEP